MTDRQTHQRCVHPELGEGVAIYENGPASFIADSGTTVAMKKIGFGGARFAPEGPEPPKPEPKLVRGKWKYPKAPERAGKWHSHLSATTLDGKTLELDKTDKPTADRHMRAIFKTLGAGWLVSLSETGKERFEADSGTVISFSWRKGYRGLPGMTSKELNSYDGDWLTYEGPDGSFVWRRETEADRNPPPPEVPAQSELF